MPVIAVINRKGGSGKSTVATHIAASLARAGCAVMLGDVDRQQSSRGWLRRRSKLDAKQAPPIAGWLVDKTSVARPPPGTTHLVLDTPGGMAGFDLARLVMWCDTIVLPMCDSAFDREAAAACHAELQALPRVASGRCRVGVLGVRIDRRTRGHALLEAWTREHEMHYLGSLRDTQLYVSCAGQGLTLFDLPPQKSAADLAQWAPVLAWLQLPAGSAGAGAAAPASAGVDEAGVDEAAPVSGVVPAATAVQSAPVVGAVGAAPTAMAVATAPPGTAPGTAHEPPARVRPAAVRRLPTAARMHDHADSRTASISLPPSIDADLSELSLTGIAKPGLWGQVRRLLKRRS